jgi:ATP-dependent exoDNAse (exonuclease V) beta subunit
MAQFNIYKASAGSGKTYTLVKEYVKKCLSSQSSISHKSLLAITFTNKAASEMKNRILSTLFSFSKGEKKDFYFDLKKELNYTDQQLIEKSKKSLSDIIHYYSLFSVSTIDKFIHKVIRNFSYELDLPPNFEVEMDSKKLIQDAVFSLLDQVGSDKSLTEILLKFSEHKTHQEKYWDIENDLLEFGEELFKDRIFLVLNNILDVKQIQEQQVELFKQIQLFEKTILNYYHRINHIIKDIPDEAFIYKALPQYLNKIKKKQYKQLDIEEKSRLYKCIQSKIWYAKNADSIIKNQINSVVDDLGNEISKYLDFLHSNYAQYLFHKEYYNSLFFVSVLTRISQKIDTNKKDNNIVHISEFNQIISHFLNNTSAPFIYEKIGNKYDHHFIDEFQDTSIIQWANLLPLIENSLASSGSCLIVGDGKQSIYRWRGGEVEQFIRLCNKTSIHNLQQFSQKISSLDVNYRSAKNIVDFNNDFFSFLSAKLPGQYNSLYNSLSQKKFSQKQGYVEISIIDADQAIVENTLAKVYETILEIKNDNYNFSDIFILTRKNSEITECATYLAEKGIPVISSEALLLNKSQIVQFLLNVLRVTFNPDDVLSRIRIIEYLIFNQLIKVDTYSISEQLYEYSKISFKEFINSLNSLGLNYSFERYINLNLYELIENIIRDFKLKIEHNLFVTFFLDVVLDYSTNKNNSLREFLFFWELKRESLSIVIPPGIDAVEIITIHKSKGLEFPVVIFPFANWKEDLGHEHKWFSVPNISSSDSNKSSSITLLPIKKEFEKWPPPFPDEYDEHKTKVSLDNINLLYVALTRAEDRLYVYPNSDYRRGNTYKYFIEYFNSKKIKDHSLFYLGEKTKQDVSKSHPQRPQTNKFISYSWRDRLKIKNKYFFNKDIKTKYSINRGNLIHDIMAEINTPKDLNKVVNYYVKKGLLTKKGMGQIKIQINNVLNHPKIKHLFNSNTKVFSEHNILSKNGEVLRPDRVVLHSKELVSLIDYKTGEEHKRHYRQMNKYEKVLLEMGFQKVEKYLVYLTKSENKVDVEKI